MDFIVGQYVVTWTHVKRYQQMTQKVISTELAKSSNYEILVKYSLNCQSSHAIKKSSPFVCGHFIPPPH